MSAYHILELEEALRVRLFAYVKVVHELGSDRCETGRSLSTVNKISLSRKLTVVREDPVR